MTFLSFLISGISLGSIYAIIALGVGMVPGYARMMRASVMTVRGKEFVESAKSKNCSTVRIILKHIIPNAIGPMIVQITMGVGSCILSGAALSFIGLGVQAPTAEWGAMISDARASLRQYPTQALYPGLPPVAEFLLYVFQSSVHSSFPPLLFLQFHVPAVIPSVSHTSGSGRHRKNGPLPQSRCRSPLYPVSPGRRHDGSEAPGM